MKKAIIRKMLALGKGGRMQISSHGAGRFSIQVIRNGKIQKDIDLPTEVVRAAKLS